MFMFQQHRLHVNYMVMSKGDSLATSSMYGSQVGQAAQIREGARRQAIRFDPANGPYLKEFDDPRRNNRPVQYVWIENAWKEVRYIARLDSCHLFADNGHTGQAHCHLNTSIHSSPPTKRPLRAFVAGTKP